MTIEGGSAGAKASSLRAKAADARARAERLDAIAQRYEAGALGEQRVASALNPLEGPHCYVYHDRLLRPGHSKVNLDHIVVSDAGTYLIDAKNWTGHVSVIGDSIYCEADGHRRGRDRELDKVSRMAAEMRAATGVDIEAVVCLAGEHAADFGPARLVRGVHVVAVDGLASWLLARPRSPILADLRTQAISVAATFPSATMPALLSIPTSHRSYPASRRQRQGPPRSSYPPKSRGRSSGRTAAEGRQLLKAFTLVGIALMLSLTTFGRGLLAGASKSYATWFSHTVKTESQNRTWVAPCHAVPDATVSATAGVPVYRYLDGSHDQCSWGLQPRQNHAAVGQISIETGYLARARMTGSLAAYVATPGTISLAVPQFARLPGSSRPAGATTQPIYVSVRYAGTTLSAAQAKRVVTTLAGETAAHLPTGPGATEIRAR